jgi:hypothetical protein
MAPPEAPNPLSETLKLGCVVRFRDPLGHELVGKVVRVAADSALVTVHVGQQSYGVEAKDLRAVVKPARLINRTKRDEGKGFIV